MSPFSEALRDCVCCPRNCHADRTAGRTGYCRIGDEFAISSIFAHQGEEPVISGPSGICNIFFDHCNLQCIYCQNYQISCNDVLNPQHQMKLSQVITEVESILDTSVDLVGFVSPSHVIAQMKAIIDALEARGRRPGYVFNTNSYDKRETIQSLEGVIDVYLPDLKYMDADLARRYSDAPDYPTVAANSLREMFRQKGAAITLDDNGVIRSGMIIRHLVLPGQVQNSIDCLRFIAAELSTSIHISLMSQYYPVPAVAVHPELGRHVTAEEYETVLAEFHRLGFHKGWVQQLQSHNYYRPDFDRPDVFRE